LAHIQKRKVRTLKGEPWNRAARTVSAATSKPEPGSEDHDRWNRKAKTLAAEMRGAKLMTAGTAKPDQSLNHEAGSVAAGTAKSRASNVDIQNPETCAQHDSLVHCLAY